LVLKEREQLRVRRVRVLLLLLPLLLLLLLVLLLVLPQVLVVVRGGSSVPAHAQIAHARRRWEVRGIEGVWGVLRVAPVCVQRREQGVRDVHTDLVAHSGDTAAAINGPAAVDVNYGVAAVTASRSLGQRLLLLVLATLLGPRPRPGPRPRSARGVQVCFLLERVSADDVRPGMSHPELVDGIL
jgi:hypothetical protein